MGTGCMSGRFMGTCLLLRLEGGQIQWKSRLFHRLISLRHDFLSGNPRIDSTRRRRWSTLLRHSGFQSTF